MKKIFVDLEKCYKCRPCSAKCGYFYHRGFAEDSMAAGGGSEAPVNRMFGGNDGVSTILERISKMLVCRQCEAAPCVKGCVFDALEKQEDGKLKRYNMLCTGCQTCSLACPFGVVYPQTVPYLTSQCDYCVERCGENEVPLCVATCPEGAIQYIEVEESPEKDLFSIGEHLVAHAIPWRKGS